ncbi:MAG: hypothetical protein E6J76_08595 [Deltaproteobacteria bacterium]|nr:MAG: hypothetical protein E6J76_08595 [Deltaproteobacteria bacterium]
MSPSLRALVWFAAWTLVLAFVMVNHRVYFVLTGQRKIPVFAALILAAVSSGKSAITDPLAMIAVYARMVQSTVHLISISQGAVAIRAAFYTLQMLIMVLWAWRLLGA